MLRIRLRRVGAKKHPAYRVVVADSRTPRNGAYVEQVGQYDPMTNPPTVRLDSTKLQDWMKKGAQPSESVQRLIKSQEAPKEG